VGPQPRSPTTAGNSDIETIEGVEVTDDASVAKLAAALEGRNIDILINNAGILLARETIDDLNWDGMRQQFEVNTLGQIGRAHV